MYGLLLLLLLPASLRLLPAPGVGAWRTRIDLPLVALLAVGVAAVSADWLARFHLSGGPLSAVDFGQYCEAVGAAAAGEAQAINPQRSFLIARLLAFPARHLGVVDALTWGACAGLAAVVAGVAVWAHAVAGRTAAFAAAIVTGAISPLVLLARNPTFYAELHGAFALASGAAAMAISTRTTGWVFAGAAAAAVAPWFDQRGVFWTVACGATVALAAVVPNPGPRRGWRALSRLVLVASVLAMGWYGARPIWALGGGLEPQVYAFAETITRNGVEPPGSVQVAHLCAHDPPFRWGWSSPADLPRAVRCMTEQVAAIPAVAATRPSAARGWSQQVEPWVVPIALAGLLAVVWLARTPARLLALLVPLLPCLGAVDSARFEPDVRRLATMALFVPVVFGVAFAVLAEAGRASERAPRGWVTRPATAVLLVLIVLGVIPTWFAPNAGWRTPFVAQPEWEGIVHHGGNGTTYDLGCQRAASRVPGVEYGRLSARWRSR